MIQTKKLQLTRKDKKIISDMVDHTTMTTSQMINYLGELFGSKLTVRHFMYLGFRMGYYVSKNEFLKLSNRKN